MFQVDLLSIVVLALFDASFNNPKLTAKKQKTYNSEDSLVVTHPTTNSPACGLSTAERTGSPVFHTLWSYVLICMQGNIIS
ncbi:hypothetical protein N7463_001155 [Penicillium fimorum]|uniref:Secreted protein n=1 Tax=Penicillium fimorum TaxID=1882269 RepID=A0A9W9Y7T2_9EURO|nr:hypothetical protein N7463_001155 [Penicillium fimorum]